MSKDKKQYFGTDGIRGRANTHPMTAKMAMKIAMAATLVLQKHKSNGDKTNRVVIGKDTRLSGYMLEPALTTGFVSMGMDVVMTGPIPTPGIAMLTRAMRADLGVMLSASHNPYEDNGIKLFGADGYKLDDALEAEIEDLIDVNLNPHLADATELGRASRMEDALGRYIEYIKGSFQPGRTAEQDTLDGLKVVVDCAHGAAYKVAPQVLWELEAEVTAIGVTPNGKNINKGFGATATENLQREVVEQGADVGVALDGDADRLIMVDEKGDVIDGDQIMAALALDRHERGRLKGRGIVATVMSNMGLEKCLEARGMHLKRVGVGDRHVIEAMHEGDYNLGGEQSGHMILSDYGTTGDGLLAALQALRILKASGKKTSEVFRVFEPFPQVLKNVEYEGDSPLNSEPVQDEIKKIEAELADKGRVLVRASGTQTLIRVMVEGQDKAQIEAACDHLCAVIKAA